MRRIGEVAREYEISNRTLRHWEDAGILKSIRTENGYRYYDDSNVTRIHQIILLRNLKMPISEIERIFVANDVKIALDALATHLGSLKQDAITCGSLSYCVEKLIDSIKGAKKLEQIFPHMERINVITDSEQEDIPQIQLSERINLMKKESLDNVRLVKLPAMTVATYCVESASPEEDCAKIIDPFVRENKLDKRSGYRYFGFNNPDPKEGNSTYGYEIWVTIPEDFDVPTPFGKKQFEGGLYASISAKISEMESRWGLLFGWVKDNEKYEYDCSTQWLEELTMDLELFDAGVDRQLDLLMPIRYK